MKKNPTTIDNDGLGDTDDRLTVHILFALHSLSFLSLNLLSLLALIGNYLKREDSSTALMRQHHQHMISVSWKAIIALIVSTVVLVLITLFSVGTLNLLAVSGTALIALIAWWIGYAVINLWYLFHCLRAWLRFYRHRAP